MRRLMTEVRTFNVKLMCDCGGEIRANGNVLETSPPVYAHQCLACSKSYTLDSEYPTETMLEVGDPQEIPLED